jgi:hypothetical protein
MYSSPTWRISLGKNFLCARNSLLYNGIGGRRANGAGLKPFVVPAAVGVAINNGLYVDVVLLVKVKRSSRVEASGVDP